MIEINAITPEVLERISHLSPRQYEIFELIGKGVATKELSRIPGRYCAIKTIESHLAHLRTKLKVKSRYELNNIATRFAVYLEQNNLTRQEIEQPRARTFSKFVPKVGI